jgi:hypothetical protein
MSTPSAPEPTPPEPTATPRGVVDHGPSARALRLMAAVRWLLLAMVTAAAGYVVWTSWGPASSGHGAHAVERYYCPMHPEVRSPDPGRVPDLSHGPRAHPGGSPGRTHQHGARACAPERGGGGDALGRAAAARRPHHRGRRVGRRRAHPAASPPGWWRRRPARARCACVSPASWRRCWCVRRARECRVGRCWRGSRAPSSSARKVSCWRRSAGPTRGRTWSRRRAAASSCWV